MSVPAFKNAKSKVRRRRSHHALKKIGVMTCKKCQSPLLPHIACPGCGNYNNRQVGKGIEEVKKTLDKRAKKTAKKVEEKQEAQA